ncbi:MAG: hypothetical protein AAF718_04540 [Pseudomonadota bacterium]
MLGNTVKTAIAALCVAFTFVQTAAADTRVQVITSRSDGAVELFFSMPTDLALGKFGLTAADLVNDRGFADFDMFARGTFDLGEDFWDGARTWIDGAPVEFEAMSLMMHPVNTPLPFRKPLDALTAIEVCGTVLDDVPLSDTRIYVGLIAYPDTPAGNIAIEFADSFGPDTKLHLRDFSDHNLMYSAQFDVGDTSSVDVPSVTSTDEPLAAGIPLWLVLTLVGGLAYGATRGNGPFFA